MPWPKGRIFLVFQDKVTLHTIRKTAERPPNSRMYGLTNEGRSVLSNPNCRRDIISPTIRCVIYRSLSQRAIGCHQRDDRFRRLVVFGGSVTITSQHERSLSVESIPMTNDVSVLDINISDAKHDGNRCIVVSEK